MTSLTMTEQELRVSRDSSVALLSQWIPFLEHPGHWYNVANLSLAAVGASLGIWALRLAYGQLAKTLRAAQAAQMAAQATARRLEQIYTIIDFAELCSLAREIRTWLISNEFKAARLRTHDLRMYIARVAASQSGQVLESAEGWQAMVTELSGMQDAIDNCANDKAAKAIAASNCTTAISKIEERLNTLRTLAAGVSKAGDFNANT